MKPTLVDATSSIDPELWPFAASRLSLLASHAFLHSLSLTAGIWEDLMQTIRRNVLETHTARHDWHGIDREFEKLTQPTLNM
jgi:hypothetical protein